MARQLPGYSSSSEDFRPGDTQVNRCRPPLTYRRLVVTVFMELGLLVLWGCSKRASRIFL
jgi:hypothetical protein